MNFDSINTFVQYISEAKAAPKNFKVIMNGEEYEIKKSIHISTPRGKTNKVPRDGGLSKGKYEKLLSNIENKIDNINNEFSIVWFYENNSYGIYFKKENKTLIAVTAIFKEDIKNYNSLFKDTENRIQLGNYKL